MGKAFELYDMGRTTHQTVPGMYDFILNNAEKYVRDYRLSEELNIPAVFGTRTATKTLKDGDMVEIDAEKGTVKKVDAPAGI